MKALVETFKNSGVLHHAYLIEGGAEIVPELFDFFETKLKVQTVGNPDLWHGNNDSFSIDDARILIDRQHKKTLSDGRKIFVIELRGITIEAQNALLKVLEEPTTATHFFFIAPTRELFLPTVRSRLYIIDGRASANGKLHSEALDFLARSPKERLEFIEEIVEEKDKARAAAIIDGIILNPKARVGIGGNILKELMKSRAYLNDRSTSLKLILEHCSLIVPRISP